MENPLVKYTVINKYQLSNIIFRGGEFVMKVLINTDRLNIREFSINDVDLIFDINNDKECIRFNGWDSMSEEKCKEDIEKWINKYRLFPGTGAFCVEDRLSKDKIGMAFIVKTKGADEYEIGFRLRRVHWDKGYAKEISRAFINYAKDTLNAQTVIGEVYKDNLRSRNVFQKLNFKELPYPGSEDGLIYKYEILK